MALDFPQSPIDGQGYKGFEWDATAGAWRVVKQFVDPADIPQAIQFLCVAGGGAGGYYTGGGGGGGGFMSSVIGEESYNFYDLASYGEAGKVPTIPFSGSFTVTVGAGAASGAANGSNSQIGSFVSYGGGRGGTGGGAATYAATAGGSGGGGGTTNTNRVPGSPSYLQQGFYGGYAPLAGGLFPSGGGGGAGQRGGQPIDNTDLNNSYGGDGRLSTITGSAVYYAGGGGASNGAYPAVGGAGGLGGGGAGSSQNSGGGTEIYPTNGQQNTGGGGGGGVTIAGGTATTLGGSGIVVLRYPVSLPTLTTIGAGLTYDYGVGDNYRIYTFTAGTGTVTI